MKLPLSSKFFANRKMRFTSRGLTTAEITGRSRPLRICCTAGGCKLSILANCGGRWIIFIRGDWRRWQRGLRANSAQPPCAKRWADSLECTALPPRFLRTKSTMWWELLVDPGAAVSEQFYGSAMSAEPYRHDDCRLRSSILHTIKRAAMKGRSHSCVRRFAASSSTNVAKQRKAKPTNDRSRENRRDNGRPADRERRGCGFE